MTGANQSGVGTTLGYDTAGRLSSTGAKWLGWTDTGNGKEGGLGLDSDYKSFGKYNLTDSVGSVSGQVDPVNGAISARQSFGPFGEEASSNAGDSGFGGRDRVGNGILYFRNRMYSPLLGRFLSEDPIGFDGSPDGNFFAYCGNDPVNFTDPLGLSPLGDGLMTGVAGLADGGVDAISFLGDPNQWNNYGWTLVPDEYNPGAQLRKWYRDYTAPTYGSYRCMEGYGVSHGLAEFGAGVVFSHGAGMALEGVGGLQAGAGIASEGAAVGEGGVVAQPKGIWNPVVKKNLSGPRSALNHWNKHQIEFPELNNSLEYVKKANDIINNPTPGTLVKTGDRGWEHFYVPSENTYVAAFNGRPATMLRPGEGLEYFLKQTNPGGIYWTLPR